MSRPASLLALLGMGAASPAHAGAIDTRAAPAVGLSWSPGAPRPIGAWAAVRVAWSREDTYRLTLPADVGIQLAAFLPGFHGIDVSASIHVGVSDIDYQDPIREANIAGLFGYSLLPGARPSPIVGIEAHLDLLALHYHQRIFPMGEPDPDALLSWRGPPDDPDSRGWTLAAGLQYPFLLDR